MKIQIKNRYNSEVIFECEADNMGIAVKLAISAKIDLSWANLSGANLSRANLSGADLSGADLSGADLSGANLDFTAIPMHCGTLKGVKVDFNLVCQMLLHVFALECEDKRFIAVKKVIDEFAKLSTKWHYYEEKHK